MLDSSIASFVATVSWRRDSKWLSSSPLENRSPALEFVVTGRAVIGHGPTLLTTSTFGNPAALSCSMRFQSIDVS